MQIPQLESVSWFEQLSQVDWPADAVFVADAGLPSEILSKLPEPLLLVEAGEGLKTLARLEQLAQRVLAVRSTRPLTLIAVGGGSIGDAVGFLASVLWRGVELWHVPTTLLAMVDSSHGGKTAVNLGDAKNQLGTFYLAQRVCVVAEILAALPLKQRQEGLAELVKALWLDDAPGLALLDEVGVEALAHRPYAQVGESLWALLKRAVAVKYRVVAKDPEERLGIRTWLNLGHTAAHALELSLGLSHGLAVAWGMAAMAEVSARVQGLEPAQAMRLRAHVEPLLYALGELEQGLSLSRFEALVLRDKKRVGGKLRSVLLADAASPVVTEAVSAKDWYEALVGAHERWSQADVEVIPPAQAVGEVRMLASKSELNRALVIQALRPGPTQVIGESDAEDVVAMRRCLAALSDDEAQVAQAHAGLGGTTLRFALATAAARHGRVSLLSASPRLIARPHDGLIDALRHAGAQIELVQLDQGGAAFKVQGWSSWPSSPIPVRVDQSSQYATALALLSASGAPVTLLLRTGDDEYRDDAVASRAYLEMTLALLRIAGVDARWEGALITLTPTPALHSPVVLEVDPDESSAALWRAINALGGQVALRGADERGSRQADKVLHVHLAALLEAADDAQVVVELHDAPDLAPVLVACAAQLPCGLTITGAEHLRLKESNRIEELIEALAGVGVRVEAREDGMVVAPGVQRPTPGARFKTFKDHRLAMAALVLTSTGHPLRVERAMVVAKSYPELWHHARQCGWTLRWDV